MQYTKLGNTDMEVSRFCLGCMSLGDSSRGMHTWAVPFDESKEIIGYAYDNGINFFDTAMSYQDGTGEEYLGRAIKELGIRNNVFLATKYTPRNTEELLQMTRARRVDRAVYRQQSAPPGYRSHRPVYHAPLGL